MSGLPGRPGAAWVSPGGRGSLGSRCGSLGLSGVLGPDLDCWSLWLSAVICGSLLVACPLVGVLVFCFSLFVFWSVGWLRSLALCVDSLFFS